MSTPTIRPLVALAVAAALSLAVVGTAVAQEEASPSPVPDPLELREERRAEHEAAHDERKAQRQAEVDERKAERAAAREARKEEREAARALRHAEREERKAARTRDREERKALRTEAREQSHAMRAESRERRQAARRLSWAAWVEVREACGAEMRSVLEREGLERRERRVAMREARMTCWELYREARSDAAAEAGPIDAPYSAAAGDGTGVVRTDLGIAEPESAPGEQLGLWHYRIPPQTDLAPHTHPGWQLARVTGGELEYTVLEGEGILLRGDESEPMAPGTYLLRPGDGVIENPELVHKASSGARAVTIISATLFPAGEPISTLVESDEHDRAEADEASED